MTNPDHTPAPYLLSDEYRMLVLAKANGWLLGKDIRRGIDARKEIWPKAMPTAKSWDYPLHWCGAFTLVCLKEAGLCATRDWKLRLGYLTTPIMAGYPCKPGDVAYFHKNNHFALVERIEYDVHNPGNLRYARVHTIDGNQGALGDTIARRERPYQSVAAFYTIEPFIREVLSK
jgi:hypothetical protein